EAKQRVLIKLETTAQTLSADYEKKLSQLQESCSHKKTKWMDLAWAPVLYCGRALVCLRCEKRLKIKQGWESVRAITPKETKQLPAERISTESSPVEIRGGLHIPKTLQETTQRQHHQSLIEAARPAVRNWSVMERVVSLLLALSCLNGYKWLQIAVRQWSW